MKLWIDFHQIYIDTLFGGGKMSLDFDGIDLISMVIQVLFNFKF